MTLQSKSTLQEGKYIIKKVLGQGGFGITYLAEHRFLGTNVAIKEFFMKDFSTRSDTSGQISSVSTGNIELVRKFHNKFIKEARDLARLNHNNIVRIHDIFEENDTAYYVMEYCEGGSLAELIKKSTTGISEEIAKDYIIQIAFALQYIHEQKMTHLDIKPANIMLKNLKEVMIIDFGLSKQYDSVGEQTSTTPVGISEGFAPIEQYNSRGIGAFSPASDVYSLGATFFKLLSGVTPPSANDILNDGLPSLPFHISRQTRNAIEKAMQPRKKDRPQTMLQFLELLGIDVQARKKEEEKEQLKKEIEKQLEEKKKEENDIIEEVKITDNKISDLQEKLNHLLEQKASFQSKHQVVLDEINELKIQLQQIDNPEAYSTKIQEQKIVSIGSIVETKDQLRLKILSADYSELLVYESNDMMEFMKKMIMDGYTAEAGKYYIDQTGLDVDDAIEYLTFLENKEDRTKLI